MINSSSVIQNGTQQEEITSKATGFQYSMPVQYNVILGSPRSGTTFLFNSLNALPKSECSSGHLFPLALSHIVNHSLPEEIYQCLSNSFEFSIQDFLESVHKSRIRHFHKWLTHSMTTKELVEAWKGNVSIERFVYKEPFLAFAPEFVYKSLPNCRIIHIYRDGRDCADSLIRKYDVLTDEKLSTLKTAEMPLGRKFDYRYVPWWVEVGREEEFLAHTPFARAIWMWKEMVHRCYSFFSRPEVIESGRVLQLKYEDLVSDPIMYGEIAVNHFGCEMNSLLEQKFKGARRSSVAIHKRLDPTSLRVAEEIAYEELSLYGYLEK